MLTHIAIRHFQSLRKVDLDLGEFTVIVGPSSSGKSSLIRAFRALASNVRGSSVITRGQRSCAITASTDTHTITLERSETSGSYRLSDASGAELTFTKLNGGVPEHVTRALRIEPVPATGTSINFAAQFDKPYLLDDSGANVARVLGELTNVNILFEAVRSANKVRLNATSTLRTRNADMVALRTRLSEFDGLRERLALLETAEKLYEQAEQLRSQLGRLEQAIRTLQIAERAIEKAALPDVPSSEPLSSALDRMLDLRNKLAGISALAEQRVLLDERTRAFTADQHHLEEVMHDTLRDAGVCPTCGQATT